MFMRLLVCGGRDYRDRRAVFATLDGVAAKSPVTLLIEGGARGADALAAAWARERDVPVATFHADWEVHGASAGPLRNIRMLEEGAPDLVVAFPGGRGTAHMTRIAREAGTPVLGLAPGGGRLTRAF